MDNPAERSAYRRCLRYLAPRPRSTREIRDYLGKKGVSEAVIDTVIQRLSDEELLNDADFARILVESRERFKPRSRFALTCELRQKGIDERLIQAAIEGVDDASSAWRAVAPRITAWQKLTPERLKGKVFNFLRYRGFAHGICLGIWHRVKDKNIE